MSTAKFNQWLNSDGTENYKCRAWVNFNGTGTVAIRASGNVSSITGNGTGTFVVNFTNAMPDANYSIPEVLVEVLVFLLHVLLALAMQTQLLAPRKFQPTMTLARQMTVNIQWSVS